MSVEEWPNRVAGAGFPARPPHHVACGSAPGDSLGDSHRANSYACHLTSRRPHRRSTACSERLSREHGCGECGEGSIARAADVADFRGSDDAKFEDIPTNVVPRTVRLKDPTFETRQARDWIFGGYCEKLLYKNEKLREMLQRFLGRLDAPECWNRLTQGQRFLYSLAALDGQVKNGGITQFFWNCPDLIFPASDALAALKYAELSVSYDHALESLIGKKDRWVELRNHSGSDPKTFWQPFQATYDLLDLNWFDDAYFDQYGPTLIDLLLKYVQENRAEFIEP